MQHAPAPFLVLVSSHLSSALNFYFDFTALLRSSGFLSGLLNSILTTNITSPKVSKLPTPPLKQPRGTELPR